MELKTSADFQNGYDAASKASRLIMDAQETEIAKLRDTVEHYKADAAHDEALINRLKAALREIDAMIPQYIDFVQPKIRKALANEQ
jgi:hypothetical protein